MRRSGSVARDCFTGQAHGREVTVGDALDTLTLLDLCETIREAIGEPALTLAHTCDVLVEETCRQWPERTMAKYASKLDSEANGVGVLDAIPVITARVGEQIEARWGLVPSHAAAIHLLARAVVIEFANLWFSSIEVRIDIRSIIAVVRHTPRA
jgi:hypothetical protein